MVLFVPIGGMTAMLLKKKVWLAVVFGLLLSASIEVTQVITHRGLFEFDNISHNTLGSVLGVVLFLILRRFLLLSSERERRKRESGKGGSAGEDGDRERRKQSTVFQVLRPWPLL